VLNSLDLSDGFVDAILEARLGPDGEAGTEDDGITQEDMNALGLNSDRFTLEPEYVTITSEGSVGDVVSTISSVFKLGEKEPSPLFWLEGKEKPEEEKKISALKEKALRVKAENENNPAPDILLQTIEDGYYTPEQMEKIAELIFDPRVSVEKSFTNNDKKIGFTVNIKKTNTFLMNFILGEDNPWELVEKRMTKTNTKLQKLSPEVE